ncbi:MAG: response regulator [Granulosicoccus sp.]|nr:response regulator [Granulosicoccus sp.]
MNRSRLKAMYKARPRLPARFHITFGLASVVTSIILLANFAGFVPNREAAILEGRLALSEAVASSTSLLLERGRLSEIRSNLEFVVNRQDALSSVVLMRGDNLSQVTIGEPVDGEQNAIRVPLVRGKRPWGELIFHFNGLDLPGWLDRWRQSPFGLMTFVALFCLPSFYFYLGKMLKELNPSSAVPGRVRSALDTIAEALIVIDRKGNIVLANSAFAALNGKSAESLLGVQAGTLEWQMLDDDHSQFPWQLALDTGLPTRNAMTGFVDCEGSVRKFLVNCSPVTGAQGRVGGVLISMDDVTLLEEKEMLLRQSMHAAEEANHAKSAFLSNMSHEIRTPMTAILGFTEVLKRGLTLSEDEQQKHLCTISNSGQHLLELINDVLDLSKIESGAMEVEAIPTNVCRIAHEVIKVLDVKANEKQVDLQMELLSDLPENVVTDPARLRQILTNLVGNAIKFTEQGSVTIGMSCNRDDELIKIEVVDTGIGMTAAQQASIFDAFTQADTSITRRFGGTGLGLSISRTLAEVMGGSIELSSAPGQGSTFTLTVPTGDLAGVPMCSAAQLLAGIDVVEQPGESHWEFPEVSVLVVDDAVENRDLLSLVLRDLGIDVTTASNGLEAVDLVEKSAFSAILMDIQMPVMDGYEALTIMRAKGVKAPVVALTANAMKGYEQKIIDAGFSHYQTKPIDLDQLARLLAGLLGGVEVDGPNTRGQTGTGLAAAERRSGSQHGYALQAATPASSGSKSTAIHEPVYNSLAETNPRFRPIVEQFLRKLQDQLQDMREHCDAQRWNALAEQAHWLKGSGGTVGFDQLSAPARLLEIAAINEDRNSAAQVLQQLESLSMRMRTGAGHTVTAGDEDSRPDLPDTGSVSLPAACGERRVTQIPDRLSKPAESVDSPVISSLLAQNPRFHHIVERFITKLEGQIAQLESAYEQNDWDGVAELAHWLKGSGGSVGFDGYTQRSYALEQAARARSGAEVRSSIDSIVLYTRRVMQGWNGAGVQRNSA